MRILTHADRFLCPHNGSIMVDPPSAAPLKVGGIPVLLIEELQNAKVGCPFSNKPCTKVLKVINSADPCTNIAGKEPVLEGATVLTDQGPATAILAPSAVSWSLDPKGPQLT